MAVTATGQASKGEARSALPAGFTLLKFIRSRIQFMALGALGPPRCLRCVVRRVARAAVVTGAASS